MVNKNQKKSSLNYFKKQVCIKMDKKWVKKPTYLPQLWHFGYKYANPRSD